MGKFGKWNEKDKYAENRIEIMGYLKIPIGILIENAFANSMERNTKENDVMFDRNI